MSGRPEGTDDGGYSEFNQDPGEFTPWRPGDASSDDDRVRQASDGVSTTGWGYSSTDRARPNRPAGQAQDPRPSTPSRWWTEDQPEILRDGDRVRSTRPVGGLLGGAVPANTVGHVRAVRTGLFDDVHVTVEFGGYTTEVGQDDVRYEGRGGWY